MIAIFVSIYLPRFFDWVIETSIMASILVGLILFVKTLLRNKLPARWHYLLWMILIVRLLLPWSPDSSYSIYSILSYGYESIVSFQNQPIAFSENEQLHETKSLSDTNVVAGEERYATGTLQTTKESNKETIRIEKQSDNPIPFYTISLYIWLTGVGILGFITYLVNRRLQHYIKQQPVLTDERVVKIFESCKKSMSIQQNIPLLLAGKIPSPTVLGFFQPRVLLSSDQINRLNEQQLRHIFHHELAHIKRKDVGLNWLMHFLLILNWFNPVIWVAYVYMREDQELACDAYALTFMEEGEKVSYGYTIINLLEYHSKFYPVPNLANLSRNKRTLKRRIFMIKKFKRKSYHWSALGIIAVVVVAAVSLLNAQAGGSNENQKEKITDQETVTEMKKEETVDTNSPDDIEGGHKNTDENLIDGQSNYPHIVLNGFYYKKTDEEVTSEQLGEQVGEVKRIGTWAIKKSGDSNYIAPGPIYSVKDRSSDEYIVGRGGLFKDGVNKLAYIVFKKEEPVQQVDYDKILNTKGDLEEALIAVDNIKRKMDNFYQINNTDRVELNYVSYLPENGPGAELIYNIREADKTVNGETNQGMLFIKEYAKQLQPSSSRFEKYVWKIVLNGDVGTKQKQEALPPVLIDKFEMNGILWSYYTDQERNDIVLRGEKDDMYYEVTTQGDFSLEKLKELLIYFTKE